MMQSPDFCLHMRKILFILICFICSLACRAQQNDEGDISTEEITVDMDNETPDTYQVQEAIIDTFITPHIYLLSTDSQKAWKSTGVYAYHKNLDSLLKDWQHKAERPVVKRTYKKATWFDNLLSAGLFKTILWIIAIIFIAFVLSKLVLNKGMFEKRPKNNMLRAVNEEEEKDLDKNFEQLISESEIAGDMRSAIRYRFLRTLQILGEKELIVYDKDKTNKHYLKEMPVELKQQFSTLIRFYEYAWYGHVQFTEDHHVEIRNRFTDFNQSLSRR